MKWFPDYSSEEKALMYGITGGIPMYLEQFSPKLTIKENLLENLFVRNAALFEEPSNLLKQEFMEQAIITAIALGKMKLSEIASTWWGDNPRTHKQAQIDIVVTSAEDDSKIIGSCKFRGSLVGEEELYLMEEYADVMGHFGHRYYYLFSRSGFTASLLHRTDDVKTRFITLEDMYDQVSRVTG